jgi:hypothetical protein
MGLLRTFATPALTNQQPAPASTGSIQTRPEQQSFQTQTEPPIIIPDDETSSTSSYVTAAPSMSSMSSSYAPSSSISTREIRDAMSSLRELRDSLVGRGTGRGTGRVNVDDDNLRYDPYADESMQDRFSDRSSSTSFHSTQQEPANKNFAMDDDNLRYDPYPDESMHDRFSDRSFHITQQEPDDGENAGEMLPAEEGKRCSRI